MTDYHGTAQIAVAAGDLLEYLADVRHLPDYVDRAVSASEAGEETVRATVRRTDGGETSGEAWFRVSRDSQSLAWGWEGPDPYQGHLELAEDRTGGTTVMVTVSSPRPEDEVRQTLERTLQNLARLVEDGVLPAAGTDSGLVAVVRRDTPDSADAGGAAEYEKMTVTGHQRDVVDILVRDHREIERICRDLDATHGTRDPAEMIRRGKLVEQVTITWIPHSVAEETEVYPEVKTRIGEEDAARALQAHAHAEETLKRLERFHPDEPGFDDEVAIFTKEARDHIAAQERDTFPALRKLLDTAELAEIGERVQAVKDMAPTRPHPSAPSTPPGNQIISPAVGLFDRMRDAITGRGARD